MKTKIIGNQNLLRVTFKILLKSVRLCLNFTKLNVCTRLVRISVLTISYDYTDYCIFSLPSKRLDFSFQITAYGIEFYDLFITNNNYSKRLYIL